MDFNLVPDELLQLIVSHLSTASAKSICLTSRKMRDLTLPRIWSKPNYFKYRVHNIDFLHKISRFPINELHSKNFDCSWMEIIGFLPKLKLLHVDSLQKSVYKTLSITLFKSTSCGTH